MADEKEELAPQKQSLFGLSADDVLDNALTRLIVAAAFVPAAPLLAVVYLLAR